jgi:hypothetical protein
MISKVFWGVVVPIPTFPVKVFANRLADVPTSRLEDMTTSPITSNLAPGFIDPIPTLPVKVFAKMAVVFATKFET